MKYVRTLLQSNGDCSDDDDWWSCVSTDNRSTTASSFDSASEGWRDDDEWDVDIDSETEHAVPGEGQEGTPAWKGTHQYTAGRKVHFQGSGDSSGEAGTVNHLLVDGSWRRDERAPVMVDSICRAIARARRQRCEVVAGQPTSVRRLVRDEHPTILVRQGTATLILDARCSWSNPGYAEHTIHWKEAIPEFSGELPVLSCS